MKDHCEGSCEIHGRDLIEVRVWDGHHDWGLFTYCPEAILCDRQNGLTVFDVSACPRVGSERCHHPDPDLCCGGGRYAPCGCTCHSATDREGA